MEKSDTYRRHMRSRGFELFFKPPSSTQHRERRRLWAGLFTANGYICHIIYCARADANLSGGAFSQSFAADAGLGAANDRAHVQHGEPSVSERCRPRGHQGSVLLLGV